MYAKKNSRKAIVLLLALVMIIGCALGGTLAYLMMATPSITNTFTASNVSITLTETLPVDQTAKMVPGNVIEKNPEIVVSADSETCYVFLKVEKSARYDEFIDSTIDGAWKVLDTGVYYQEASANDVLNILVDDKVTVKADVTKAMMNGIDNDDVKITFYAYAIQKANVGDAAAAWNLVKNETPAQNG